VVVEEPAPEPVARTFQVRVEGELTVTIID
jgi:hypothetical protein